VACPAKCSMAIMFDLMDLIAVTLLKRAFKKELVACGRASVLLTSHPFFVVLVFFVIASHAAKCH